MIALTPTDLAKTGAPVQPAGRHIMFADLEKYCARAQSGQAPQMLVEERPSETAASPERRHGDRKNFRLTSGHSRKNKADQIAADGTAIGDNGRVGEETVKLIFAPAAPE